MVTVTCNAGFALSGVLQTQSSTCLASSTWSVPSPSCTFNPLTISSLRVWVGPESPLTVAGGTVSSWGDLSGNGNSFVASGGVRQPVVVASCIGGKQCLQFTASLQQNLVMSTNFPAPVSVFYVARQLGTNNQRILSGLNNNWLLGWWSGGMNQAYFMVRIISHGVIMP